MAFCVSCGKQMDDGVKFCPSCGTAAGGGPSEAPSKPAAPEASPADAAGQQADSTDAEQNKGMAVVAYILFFIPLITGDHKKSPFVLFHTNQGTVLFITSITLSIVSSIFATILYQLHLRFLAGLIGLILPLISIMIFVLFIIGIVNAVNGRMKPLPVIGNIQIIK